MALAIVACYLMTVAMFFLAGTHIWPGLLVCCAIASYKDWRPGLLLAIPVILVQFVKGSFPDNQLWVYYAVIYIILGVILSAIWDKKILGPAAILIGFIYLMEYFNQPRWILDVGTEAAFIIGLCMSVSYGPGGGLFSGFGRITANLTGRGFNPNFGLRDQRDDAD